MAVITCIGLYATSGSASLRSKLQMLMVVSGCAINSCHGKSDLSAKADHTCWHEGNLCIWCRASRRLQTPAHHGEGLQQRALQMPALPAGAKLPGMPLPATQKPAVMQSGASAGLVRGQELKEQLLRKQQVTTNPLLASMFAGPQGRVWEGLRIEKAVCIKERVDNAARRQVVDQGAACTACCACFKALTRSGKP